MRLRNNSLFILSAVLILPMLVLAVSADNVTATTTTTTVPTTTATTVPLTTTTTAVTTTTTTPVTTTTTVAIVQPGASFSCSPASGALPLIVQCTDSSTGSPTSWSWSFGDGNTSTAENPSNTYSTAGTYSVTLTAANSAGSNILTRTGYITVSAAAIQPVASFSCTPVAGTAPLTIQCSDSSTNSPTTWNWTFGDGNTSTAENPSNVYTASGTYSVSLTVTNAAGTDTISRSGYITVGAGTTPPYASFSQSKESGPAPLTVEFTDESTYSPASWSWDFGDGNSSTEENPSHTYTTEGTYNVTLIATNAGGSNTTVAADDVTVTEGSNVTPVASFTESSTTGVLPLIVQFTDTSDNSPTSWSWSFGDGGTSTEQNPSHSYANAGSYTVRLTATNAGGEDSFSRDITITNAESEPAQTEVALQQTSAVPETTSLPGISFHSDQTSGAAPLTVKFEADNVGSPESLSWDFGDGGTSTERNPSYTYVVPGTYTVVLAAKYPEGERTATQTAYISVDAADKASSPLPGVIPILAVLAGTLLISHCRAKKR